MTEVRPVRHGKVTDGTGGVTVRLPYRPPYDWTHMLAFLRARAIGGIEWIDGDIYRRSVAFESRPGSIAVAHLAREYCLQVQIRLPDDRGIAALVSGIESMFDLDADMGAIGAHLARDPLLRPMIAARPGLRRPGGWSTFEVAMRAVLGQQVSVEAGRRLLGQLVRLCGQSIPAGSVGDPRLKHIFPEPAPVAQADLASLGMPDARRRALKVLAKAALADPLLFKPLATIEATVVRLCALPGIGPWTAHYIALRGLRLGDAFPASDVGLLRGAAGPDGIRPSPADLEKLAETWRPWRSYAAQHLWAADADRVHKT